jgi:hypothetical protein
MNLRILVPASPCSYSYYSPSLSLTPCCFLAFIFIDSGYVILRDNTNRFNCSSDVHFSLFLPGHVLVIRLQVNCIVSVPLPLTLVRFDLSKYLIICSARRLTKDSVNHSAHTCK